jgi:hypothetical protein
MGRFTEAVADIQAFMREHMGEDSIDYVLSSERQSDAGRVEPCAVRWVEGEMDPTRRLAVARGPSVGPVGSPPSLAEKLGGKLERRSEDDRAAAAYAVHKALAIGYLTYAETEPTSEEPVKLVNRSTEDIWEYWVTTSRVQLEATGIPKNWVNMVRGMGRDTLVGELRNLKLTRYLGGSKINQLGMAYAQAGVHLRLAQLDQVPDDLFARRVEFRRADPERPWRFEDYTSPV